MQPHFLDFIGIVFFPVPMDFEACHMIWTSSGNSGLLPIVMVSQGNKLRVVVLKALVILLHWNTKWIRRNIEVKRPP